MKKRSKVRAVKNSKRSSNDKALNSLTKKFMLSAVQVIAEKIVLLKKRNDGKVPYGEFSKLWNAGKETYPKMSRKTINNGLAKSQTPRKTWGKGWHFHWVQFAATTAKTSHAIVAALTTVALLVHF